MIQIYADGVLTYDSRLEDYDLQGLKVTTALNRGGTAQITMPPEHPAYSSYVSHKTIVEIYRDDLQLFRGRALYPADDHFNQRTVLCEGELCFFLDAVSRPYLYQDTPAAIFAEVVGVYNSQVEAVKQFRVGTITVTDPNDYVRLESENAESVQDTINKLLERCGGYIVFTTDATDGARVINWYASLDYRSDQVIEFGENLLDFSRSGANTSLITAVLPYGAKDTSTDRRITIESVNEGKDYIVDEEARALRGFIIRPVVWDDVTEPRNLLRKAQEYLEANRYIVTSLQLSALDLSYIDKSIDTFQVGDTIRVLSKPHKVDEDFLLTERTEDLLDPAAGTITLGKDVRTLTSADVAGDDQARGEMHRVTRQIKEEYDVNLAAVIEATTQNLTSLIQQTSEAIKLEVSETYATNGDIESAISTSMTQLADEILFQFESLRTVVDANDAAAREHIVEQSSYIRLKDGKIVLGKNDAGAMTLTLENDVIRFEKNGQEFGWWDGVDFHTGNIVIEVNERAQFGSFAAIPRKGGNLSWLKVQ